MKLLTLALAVSGVAFASCEKDDNIRVDRGIEDAFRDRYPDATRAEWEFRQGYYVADFRQNLIETQAWYTPQGIWHMTETDVRYADLPQAVKGAFERSEFAGWRIDDIDMLEYPDRETVYIVEIEQAKAEYDLYFTPDGVLVKAVPEGIGTGNNNTGNVGGNTNPGNSGNENGNTNTGNTTPVPPVNPGGTGNVNGNGGTSHQPSVIQPTVREWIAQRYPQARIVDIENERYTIEVDIVDGRTPREVVFSSAGEWVYTQTEMRQADIPATVLNGLKASQYGAWRIDDVDHYLTPTGEYYLIELESGNREMNLKIDTGGNLIP